VKNLLIFPEKLIEIGIINRIIHIVDNLLPVNFGIWNAAISPSAELEKNYGVKSECWFPANPLNAKLPEGYKAVEIQSTSIPELQRILETENPDPSKTIIMTHGAWKYPTRWGNHLAGLGYKWWYVPHGMLEPWSMQQKQLKKFIYFNLVERSLIKKAELVRAVGKPEQENLKRLLKRDIQLIPNGIPITRAAEKKSFDFPRKYLFMSRLHHKKGVLPLVEAWHTSALNHNPEFELIIAGPDDGELEKLQNILNLHPGRNIRYAGAVYGEEKKALLNSSHFFILPSQSEGFPTSVVEAMQSGLIPIITEGCNFPEAFEADMAIKTGISVEEILWTLEDTVRIDGESLSSRSSGIVDFVGKNYSLLVISRMIMEESDK
jgi:glycosyltransferase involved in cell wall biosynthesis